MWGVIAELKARLSEHLRSVRNGGTLTVLDRRSAKADGVRKLLLNPVNPGSPTRRKSPQFLRVGPHLREGTRIADVLVRRTVTFKEARTCPASEVHGSCRSLL